MDNLIQELRLKSNGIYKRDNNLLKLIFQFVNIENKYVSKNRNSGMFYTELKILVE